MEEHSTVTASGRDGQPAEDSRKLRVIVGATVLGLGGIRTHLVLLCRLLRKQGLEVVVFATGSNWDQQTMVNLRELGVNFKLPPATLLASRKLSAAYCSLTWPIRVPRSARSLYCISPGFSQLLLHRLKSPATVSINHEIVEPPGAQSLAGRCAANLDATVANSQIVAKRMKGLWPRKAIKVIPFLTSDAPTPPPAPRKRINPDGLLRIVYLGRLVEQKRPDQLVKRWPILSGQPGIFPARLDVYGYDPGGRMLEDLTGFVAERGLSDQISIRGEYALSQLPRILDAADLVVLPSLWEGLPLVLVEAMLKGVPFVACGAGGTGELGETNPDVIVTSTAWEDFEAGLVAMAMRIRSGAIDPVRLHAWAEERYGYACVSRKWLNCLCQPRGFFDLQ